MNALRSGVLVVRHAPTLAEGLCVGDSDVPCTMGADEVAAGIRPRLADYDFATVWSSPRLRCLDPARVLAAIMGIPHRVDRRLREIGLGEGQGRPWGAIEASDSVRCQAWLSDWTDQAPPGGETTMDLQRRVLSWWGEPPSGCHLLVAHAGVIRALRVGVQGMTWAQAMREPFRIGRVIGSPWTIHEAGHSSSARDLAGRAARLFQRVRSSA
jgi:alpha-ribazole phosphatase